MKIILLTAIISVVCFFIFIGCSSTKSFLNDTQDTDKKDAQEENQKGKKLPLSSYEATLNPSDYDDEVDIVQRSHIEAKKKEGTIEIPPDSTTIVEEVIQGFRIQVYSSSNVDEAVRAKSVAIEKFFSDSVYMVYDAPVYKIRVGDFANRYEANQRLPEFIESGYRDAWIVPDRVVQRKVVRVIPLR